MFRDSIVVPFSRVEDETSDAAPHATRFISHSAVQACSIGSRECYSACGDSRNVTTPFLTLCPGEAEIKVRSNFEIMSLYMKIYITFLINSAKCAKSWNTLA